MGGQSWLLQLLKVFVKVLDGCVFLKVDDI